MDLEKLMGGYKILPSILAADHGQLVQEVKTVELPEIDALHIDIMDGHFVPNLVGSSGWVSSLKKHSSFFLDVHLMIENVDAYIPVFAKAGADLITIHQEATPHLQRSLALIRDYGCKVGVALNPATPIETLQWVFSEVDLVLVMSVNPGFGGQCFIPAALEKIQMLVEYRQQRQQKFVIEVDGGIDVKTAPFAYDAGANYLVAGNAIFAKENRRAAVRDIVDAIDDYQKKKNVVAL